MTDGVTTINVDPVSVSDAVLVNRNGSTAVQLTTDLATQLASTGAIADLIEGATLGRKDAKSWAELEAYVGEALQGGTVPRSDTGTHTDPVTGATVPNSGTYSYSTAPAGWAWTGELIDAARAEATSEEVETARGDEASLTDKLATLAPQTALDTRVLPNASPAHFQFTDEIGWILAELLTNGGYRTPDFTVLYDLISSSADRYGFELYRISESTISIAGLECEIVHGGTLIVQDHFGFVGFDVDRQIQASTSSGGSAEETTVDPEILHGGTIWMIDARPMPLFVRNMLQTRSDKSRVRATLASYASTTGAAVPQNAPDYNKPPLIVTSDDQINIDPARIGGNIELVVRPDDQTPSKRWRLPMTARIAPAALSGSPVIHMVGDSLTNRQMVLMVKGLLEHLGLTPVFIGTLNSSADWSLSTNADGPLAEGREGWETGDYTYAVTDRALQIAVGDEATYLAKTKADKMSYNPYLRDATGSDSAAVIRNGKVHDASFYLSRFSLAVPDFVVSGLLTNDVRDNALPSTAVDNLSIMHSSWRTAAPDAHIIQWFPPSARGDSGDAIWPDDQVPMIKALMGYQRASADTKLHLVSSWAHASQESGWLLSTVTPDAATGVYESTLLDEIHFQNTNRLAVAETIAAAIAWCVANPS